MTEALAHNCQQLDVRKPCLRKEGRISVLSVVLISGAWLRSTFQS